ncbi:hypothetical protein WJX79_007021 [Trebouxia sp. C0005]
MGAQPHLNPNAKTFMPGGMATSPSQQFNGGQHVAQSASHTGHDGHRKQGSARGRGRGNEGGLSRALQGRHGRNDRHGEHGRGRGRSQDSFRGSSHFHGGFQGPSQHPGEAQELSHPQPTPEVTLGGPEQSPLGRSPSNRTYSNLMLDWDDVVQVVMMTGGEVQCPISLENNPLCPQITPCGHVFAFHSIMQHLMTQGGEELRKAARCPLCYSMIAARELKLVQVHRIHIPQVNDTVNFRLLQRPRDSIIPKEVIPNHPHATPDSDPTKQEDPTNITPTSTWGFFNKYAKFTTVGDGKAFWKAAAEELARYAAQLTAEGGWDAAQEAPFLYAAMDALAARAGTWAERRQRLKIEAASEPAASVMAEPVVVSREAIAFVKQFSTAAVHAAEEQREAASKEAKRQELFPSLSCSSSATRPAQSTGMSASSTPRPKLTPLVRLPQTGSINASPAPGPAPVPTPAGHPQAAFSDDEDEDQDAETTAAATEEPGLQHQGSQQEVVASAESSDCVLGTSPAGTSGAVPAPSTEFYFYQSADGQCVFLHPLVSRALLAHYGSYAACPPEVAGQILEVEDMVQTEATRKRMKHLTHLPLSGAFKLAEVDLTPLLPPEALAPFAEEISGRQKRRHRRAEQEARMAQREAADAADAAAAAAIKGLTAQELKAMPKPSNPAAALAAASMTEEDALDAAIAQSLGLSGSPDENGDLHGAGPDGAALPPEAGVSFANIAKMGFAATGPKLSPGAPEMGRANAQHGSPGADMGGPLGPVWGPQLPGSKPAVASQGNSASAWGSSKGSTLASQLAAAETKAAAAAVDAAKDRSKGKKAAKQMVLLSTTQRRYT